MNKPKQKTIFSGLISHFSKTRVFYTSLLIVLSLLFSVGLYLSLSNKNTTSAASIAYANGQVSLDKKYYQNNNEVSSLSTIAGAELTVRVKYNNTGDQAALNSLITDSIPSNFTYTAGSLKNCYVDSACVSLSDSLVVSNTSGSCPSGYTLNGSQCEQRVAATSTAFGCPLGYTDDSATIPCVKYTPLVAGCPVGYTLYGTQCEQRVAKTSTTIYSCPNGGTLNGTNCEVNMGGIYSTNGGTINCTPASNYAVVAGVNFYDTPANFDQTTHFTICIPNSIAGFSSYPYPNSGCPANTYETFIGYGLFNTMKYFCVPSLYAGFRSIDLNGSCASNEYQVVTNISSQGAFGFGGLDDQYTALCIPNAVSYSATGNTGSSTCPPGGYTGDNGTPPCVRYVSTSGSACPSEYILNGSQCEQRIAKLNYNICPSGYTDSGGTPPCLKSVSLGGNNGTIAVAPTAGYFGFPTNSASPQDFEMGKKYYMHLVECFEASTTSNVNTYNINSIGRTTNTSMSSLPSLVPSCASTETVSFSYVQTVELLTNKYIHLVECFESSTGGDVSTFNINSANRTANTTSNNSSSLTPSCSSDQTISASAIKTMNIFGNRYIHLVECFESSTGGDVSTFNINSANRTANTTSNNDPTLTPECTSVNNNITQSAVQSFDMLDITRGYGYIEYKITPQINAIGLYGTSVSMTGNFGTLVHDASNTIDIISCTSKNPNNWTINLNLTDAELRSDQDFTCNYQPKICPVVFYDLDGDGYQSPGESNVAGQSIQLFREDGISLVTSIATDAVGANCFTSIAGGGSIYKVSNPSPLSAISTTGSNTKQVSVASNDLVNIVKFGYSSGTLSFSVPPSISFPSTSTQSTAQTICTEITPIEVSDTRINQPGWTLTGVVDNFTVLGDTKTLLVANKFKSSPGSISIISGQIGPQIGITKTVTSTLDPFTVITSGSGLGRGTFRINQGICQDLDPYTITGNYQTVITYTII